MLGLSCPVRWYGIAFFTPFTAVITYTIGTLQHQSGKLSSDSRKGRLATQTKIPTRMHHTASSTTAVVLQQKQHVQHPTHRPIHGTIHRVQQQYMSAFMQRSLRHPYVFTIPRGDGSFRRSPRVELGVRMYSSTTAEAARTAPDPPIHPPTDAPCAAAQQDVQQQHLGSFMQRGCVAASYWDFPCSHDPPPYRGPGTAPFGAPRKLRLALRPVLSPIRPYAVWGGGGGVARPRALAWRSGEPFQNGAY